uniref:Anaerobic ribonucleoside-triphosphate reductase activating protein n=1 Tax=uncultured Alphaproteobacteria bacterium TaxID=91750 RepID=A0A6G8F3F7_9PROT|nr:anaerobic ribonucleoside-triphosphate reductase activating protein [uncultured Alphaproteobacteria bacterium]
MTRNPIKVGGVETFSTVDFPDKISAVVFMQGCPWRCPFCHNAVLQDTAADSGFLWPKFVEFLQTRKKVLDGVVFSGGEPLVQDGLENAIREVKDLGFLIGLHTGGYRPEHLSKILPLLDWVGLDIKAPLDVERYTRAIGINAQPQLPHIRRSLQLLLESGIDFECRTTCDPRILSISDVKEIGDSLADAGVNKYFLQKYRPIPEDTQTEDAECEKFFMNNELIAYLRSKFGTFDIRK